ITGPVAPFAVGGVFSDINRGTSILPTQRESLKNADADQSNGSKPACRLECGHQTDKKSSKAHHRERHQEGILSAYQIANPSKKEGSERTNNESYGEGGKVSDEGKRGVSGRIEFQRQNGRQTAEYVEVVPLDHRAHR